MGEEIFPSKILRWEGEKVVLAVSAVIRSLRAAQLGVMARFSFACMHTLEMIVISHPLYIARFATWTTVEDFFALPATVTQAQ